MSGNTPTPVQIPADSTQNAVNSPLTSIEQETFTLLSVAPLGTTGSAVFVDGVLSTYTMPT